MSSAFTTAPPPSSSASASNSISVDTLITVLQRLEAKLDATDSRPSASRPPRPDPDPPYGMSSEWQAPSWTSEGLATHSVGGSIPPWPPTMSSISSWPQLDPFHQNLHEYTNGMGFHTAGPHQYPSWEPPRSRAGDFIGHRPPLDFSAVRGNPYHHTPDPAAGQHHVGFSRRLQGSNPHGSTPQHTEFTSPSSWDPLATRMETLGPSSPSSPYAYDPLLGRPLTSWDLQRPRIESYGGGGSSQYVYGASRIHGGGDYAPYSPHGRGYTGVSYANEHNPHAPSLPLPRDCCYVPAPPSYTPPQQSRDSSCSLTTPNDAQHTTTDGRKGEGGVSEMVEEENKGAEVEIEANVTDERERPTIPLEGEEESIDDDGTTERWDKALKAWVSQEELAQKKEDYGWEDMDFVQEEEVFPIVDANDLPVKKDEEAVVTHVVEKKNGKRKVREEIADKKGIAPSVVLLCKGNLFGHWWEEVFLEVSRRLVIFGLYALAEVYKDLHLEDKVILKGGGVDTLFILFI